MTDRLFERHRMLPTLPPRFFFCLFLALSSTCFAAEDLVATVVAKNGESVPYVLNRRDPPPKYVLILFPGGDGIVNPRMENGQLVYQKKSNFLLRAREYWVDDEFATAITNSTRIEERVQALIDDLSARFPGGAHLPGRHQQGNR